jgi:hypothetical protein
MDSVQNCDGYINIYNRHEHIDVNLCIPQTIHKTTFFLQTWYALRPVWHEACIYPNRLSAVRREQVPVSKQTLMCRKQ